jgi:hypothetical protein
VPHIVTKKYLYVYPRNMVCFRYIILNILYKYDYDAGFRRGNLRERDHLGDPGVDGRTI